jgi:hypothetical protein
MYINHVYYKTLELAYRERKRDLQGLGIFMGVPHIPVDLRGVSDAF